MVQKLTINTNGKHSEIIEAVSVRNGKGHKTVRQRTNGHLRTAKHKLTPKEIKNIQSGVFMPNLFTDLHKRANANNAANSKAKRKSLTKKKRSRRNA